MNIISKLGQGDSAEVAIDQIQFNWSDMINFGEWCVENDAHPTDGLMLAEYLEYNFNISIL